MDRVGSRHAKAWARSRHRCVVGGDGDRVLRLLHLRRPRAGHRGAIFFRPLITLRIVQGLALGGEYADAAAYVAEQAPPERRGHCTSYIQLMPTVGLFASSAIVLSMRSALGEPFPANVRYTSISLPYNPGNGWFGGFLPLIATSLVAWTGHPLAWVTYPIGIAVVTAVVGALLVREGVARAAPV